MAEESEVVETRASDSRIYDVSKKNIQSGYKRHGLDTIRVYFSYNDSRACNNEQL